MEYDSIDIPVPYENEDYTSHPNIMKELFRSVVTAEDRRSVKHFLRESEKELKSYEDEIRRLRSTIMALETKRNWLKSSVTRYHSLLSPIRSLPPEILSMIFAFSCEANPLDVCHVPPAVTLSFVCAQWRTIVLSSPSLWSSISIDFEHWDMIPNLCVLENMTRLFLERSKKSPLTLVLRLSEPTSCEFRASSTLNALVDSADRWCDITLLEPWNIGPSSPIFQGLRGHLPILRSLHLNGAGPRDDHLKFDFFDSCPALDSLQIQPGDDPFGPEYPTNRLVLPWEQIRSLKMRDSFAPSAISLLSQCPNVETLGLSLVGGGAKYPRDVALDALRSLSIEAREQDDVSSILQSTTLRNLSLIEICGDIGEPTRDWPYWDGGAIENMITRSSCTITSLRLKWVPITDVQLVELLDHIPTLKSLHIEEYTTGPSRLQTNRLVTEYFLNHLALVQEGGSEHYSFNRVFIPRLEDLSVVVHDIEMDLRALLKAVLSRYLPDPDHASAVGIACVRSVGVIAMGRNSSGFDPFTSLECLRAGGVRVRTSRLP
ncbi:hypothetical protein AAF712_003297 [Marasmius tenuissimus]|uniref:F-box domain-containing protein n=1 Tax=Marasmius tenuissimus TaxID=585030 RepID=A0ABR3A9H5_9AGAR|nr:hypothetical protein PM082_012126 [Marasmius tenuissimus]